MTKKFVLSAFALVFLLLAVIGAQLIVAVAAQEPGVSVGDWALYDATLTLSANATMPPEMNITWVKITVQEISGTNITFESLVHYGNGTEETDIYLVDVYTGQGNGTGNFIAKDLYEGALIYTSPPSVGPFGLVGPSFEGATINETIPDRTYLGKSVEVNNLNITKTSPFSGYNLTFSLSYYWYRATGMVAEFSIYELMQPVEGPNMWMKMQMLISDIIPEFPPALVLPTFMIVTLTAVWLGKTIWSKKSIKKPFPRA